MWLLTMQSEGLSASSVKRHLYGVRNLMRALVWAGVLDTDPSAGIRPPSETTAAHSRKRALETDYLTHLLQLPADLHPSEPARAARDKGCPVQVGTDMLFEMIPAYLEFFGFGTATPEELRATARLQY